MGSNPTGRHFLSILDLSGEEILVVLEKACELKRTFADGAASTRAAEGDRLGSLKGDSLPLKGKTLAMIFQKPSLRTRVSFETGMTKLGGHAVYLAPTDISIGQRETTEDIAIVLSRYVDIIMARVFGHHVVEELARYATVPVINGLSDLEHPCQILADFQTILERKGKLDGIKTCFIGDGNNVAHSLMLGAARVGMHMTIITPPGYEPQEEVTKRSTEIASKTRVKITVTNELTAVRGADVLYTDVWASMGQESEVVKRKKDFAKYSINSETVKLADSDVTILHCLPAHYGEEIDYETSRLPNSAIFDQAENRMHAQNALMVHLTG